MKRSLLALAFLGCSSSTHTETKEESAVEHGQALFDDTSVSVSGANRFTCATCHPSQNKPADRIFPGASLAGVTTRTSFWGGQRNDLLTSINDCRLTFMDAVAPWATSDDSASAMYAYLASLPGPPTAIPFTVIHTAPDLPAGNADRGRNAFKLACTPCHGDVHTGNAKIADYIPSLPDQFDAQHQTIAVPDRRLIVLRKIREGGFTEVGGNMPPFSVEVLSDDDVAGILSFLGRY
jgi:thiosulfate dehydrogenase